MNDYLRLYTTSNEAETQEVLADINSGNAIRINWIPIIELIMREDEVAVVAKKLEFACHLRFSPADKTGAMSINGGPYSGEWTLIDAAVLRNMPPTMHSFLELHRLKASNSHGRVAKVLVGIGHCRPVRQPEVTL